MAATKLNKTLLNACVRLGVDDVRRDITNRSCEQFGMAEFDAYVVGIALGRGRMTKAEVRERVDQLLAEYRERERRGLTI